MSKVEMELIKDDVQKMINDAITSSMASVKAPVAEMPEELKALYETLKKVKIADLPGVSVEEKKAKKSFAEVLRGIKSGSKDIISKYEMRSAAKGGFADDEKVMTEGTAADGGYLVPDEYSNQLINLIEEFSIVRPLCRKWPMKGKTLLIPVVTAGTTAYWVAENGEKTKSQPTIGQLSLSAKKLICLTSICDELLEDSNPAVDQLLMTLFAIDIANEEDRAFLHGTGAATDPITGLENLANIVVKNPGVGGMTFDEIKKGAATCKSNKARVINLITNPLGTGFLSCLKGLDGQYLWKDAAGDNPPTIGGYKVFEDANVTTTNGVGGDETILFGGDFSNANIGDRSGIVIAKGYADQDFEYDRTSFRAVKRVAFGVHTSAQSRFFMSQFKFA